MDKEKKMGKQHFESYCREINDEIVREVVDEKKLI